MASPSMSIHAAIGGIQNAPCRRAAESTTSYPNHLLDSYKKNRQPLKTVCDKIPTERRKTARTFSISADWPVKR